MPHQENHRSPSIGWLRAAVLGANDGIVSTASLILGVAAAGATIGNIMSRNAGWRLARPAAA
jgi:VIT1/CCC1 family predicted Fe2+/Mn2+ transporter